MTAAGPRASLRGSPAQRDRRRRILDAAVALASGGGFDAVQMRAVADRAGVALGTLYRYFPSKIHLLVCALDRELAQAEAAMVRRRTPGSTPADRVTALLGRATRTMQRDPQLTEALMRAVMFADASVAPEVEAVGNQVTRLLLRAMVEPGVAFDEHEPTEDELAAARVIGDVWLVGLVRSVTGRAGAADVSRSLDVAVRLVLR